MDARIVVLAVVLLLAGCGAFIPTDRLDLGSQIWRDQRGISYDD